MAVLSLDSGRVCFIEGWGRHVGDDVPVLTEFEDDGTFTVTKRSGIRNRTVVSAPADWLVIEVTTRMITSGGGWAGFGFGVGGAILGALQAEAMNRLTTRHTEFVFIVVVAELEDGSFRKLGLSFRRVPESRLRAMLAEALPRWTDLFVQKRIAEIESSLMTVEDARRGRAWLDKVAKHRLLSVDQIAQLREAYPAVERVSVESTVEISEPPRRQLPPAPDPALELRKLAYLRATGTISEDEYSRRKARLEG
jgi:hypothetical protein